MNTITKGKYMKNETIDLDKIADYVDTCVCENFDINENPLKFDTLAELVDCYTDHLKMSRAQFCELVRLCDTQSIKRLVKP